MKRALLLVAFAVFVAALAIGSIEGVRLYSQVEANDERFIGITVLVVPMVLLLTVVGLHGLMFGQREARA